MNNDLFGKSLISKSQLAKSSVAEARRGRDGTRYSIGRSDDAALELTSKFLLFSCDDQRLVQIIRRVRNLRLTAREISDGFESPNLICRSNAETLVIDLFEAFDLEPKRVATSVEGGIMLAYHKDNGLRLEIEVDNDGDIVGGISTSTQVIRTEIIDLPAKLSQLVRDFKLSRIPSV